MRHHPQVPCAQSHHLALTRPLPSLQDIRMLKEVVSVFPVSSSKTQTAQKASHDPAARAPPLHHLIPSSGGCRRTGSLCPQSHLPPLCGCLGDTRAHLIWHKTGVWANQQCWELNEAPHLAGLPLANGGSSGCEGNPCMHWRWYLLPCGRRALAENVLGKGGKTEAGSAPRLCG